ncbi:MAG: hypothetical protein JKY52_19845 [Flavobacteriales bacterium]|nr:hypothetical protein [Flavobacteriales bacterium]
MSIEDQIKIMEKQLGRFDTLMEKMQYMAMSFDPDPMFSSEARNIVRSNIAGAL